METPKRQRAQSLPGEKGHSPKKHHKGEGSPKYGSDLHGERISQQVPIHQERIGGGSAATTTRGENPARRRWHRGRRCRFHPGGGAARTLHDVPGENVFSLFAPWCLGFVDTPLVCMLGRKQG